MRIIQPSPLVCDQQLSNSFHNHNLNRNLTTLSPDNYTTTENRLYSAINSGTNFNGNNIDNKFINSANNQNSENHTTANNLTDNLLRFNQTNSTYNNYMEFEQDEQQIDSNLIITNNNNSTETFNNNLNLNQLNNLRTVSNNVNNVIQQNKFNENSRFNENLNIYEQDLSNQQQNLQNNLNNYETYRGTSPSTFSISSTSEIDDDNDDDVEFLDVSSPLEQQNHKNISNVEKNDINNEIIEDDNVQLNKSIKIEKNNIQKPNNWKEEYQLHLLPILSSSLTISPPTENYFQQQEKRINFDSKHNEKINDKEMVNSITEGIGAIGVKENEKINILNVDRIESNMKEIFQEVDSNQALKPKQESEKLNDENCKEINLDYSNEAEIKVNDITEKSESKLRENIDNIVQLSNNKILNNKLDSTDKSKDSIDFPRGIINPNYPGFQHLAHTLSEHFVSVQNDADDSDLSEFEIELSVDDEVTATSSGTSKSNLNKSINSLKKHSNSNSPTKLNRNNSDLDDMNLNLENCRKDAREHKEILLPEIKVSFECRDLKRMDRFKDKQMGSNESLNEKKKKIESDNKKNPTDLVEDVSCDLDTYLKKYETKTDMKVNEKLKYFDKKETKFESESLKEDENRKCPTPDILIKNKNVVRNSDNKISFERSITENRPDLLKNCVANRIETATPELNRKNYDNQVQADIALNLRGAISEKPDAQINDKMNVPDTIPIDFVNAEDFSTANKDESFGITPVDIVGDFGREVEREFGLLVSGYNSSILKDAASTKALQHEKKIMEKMTDAALSNGKEQLKFGTSSAAATSTSKKPSVAANILIAQATLKQPNNIMTCDLLMQAQNNKNFITNNGETILNLNEGVNNHTKSYMEIQVGKQQRIPPPPPPRKFLSQQLQQHYQRQQNKLTSAQATKNNDIVANTNNIYESINKTTSIANTTSNEYENITNDGITNPFFNESTARESNKTTNINHNDQQQLCDGNCDKQTNLNTEVISNSLSSLNNGIENKADNIPPAIIKPKYQKSSFDERQLPPIGIIIDDLNDNNNDLIRNSSKPKKSTEIKPKKSSGSKLSSHKVKRTYNRSDSGSSAASSNSTTPQRYYQHKKTKDLKANQIAIVQPRKKTEFRTTDNYYDNMNNKMYETNNNNNNNINIDNKNVIGIDNNNKKDEVIVAHNTLSKYTALINLNHNNNNNNNNNNINNNNNNNYKNSNYKRLKDYKKERSIKHDNFHIETSLPVIDLEAIENHLKKAKEEEKKRRSDREEIRRRLAMGAEDDYFSKMDNHSHHRPGRKPRLQSRLQNGMNLQICFMNDASSDTESPSDDSETCPKLSQKPTNSTASSRYSSTQSISGQHSNPYNSRPLSVNLSSQNINNNNNNNSMRRTLSQRPSTLTLGPPLPETSNSDSDSDFFTKQARLQIEARMALAQAKDMAHMQMEMERQKRKQSPITEVIRNSLQKVGVLFPAEKRRISRQICTDMNIAQLQIIVNDLHTQIEYLNEQLVLNLMERDELHMGQDSMLVDIEDLTRYLGAKEQSLLNDKSSPNGNNENKTAITKITTNPLSTPLMQSKFKKIANLVKK